MPEPHTLFEVTLRCMQQRFLLRPSRRLNALVLGVLSMAMKSQPDVCVYVFSFASNHFHIILSAPNHKALSDFMCFINTNLAKEAGRLHNWFGPFWSRRYHASAILDRESMIERLTYVLAHGVKENLVARCSQWPGANCAKALTSGEPLLGIWVDRSGLYTANRSGENVPVRDFERHVEVQLSRLPWFADLSDAEHQAKIQEIIEEIQQSAAIKRLKEGKRVMGARRVFRQNPHARPRKITRSPAPKCHAGSKDKWLKHVESYQLFKVLYRRAVNLWKAGSKEADFPPGCFLPGGEFLLAGDTGPPFPAPAGS
ncbi:MAG: transposase [Deltaproteobacteria bacterium]|nr:transposase [Deltaproteobacteria bacterium]